jgi:ribonuclease Z
MTVDDAARVASRAGVLHAVLTHISPRYTEEDIETFIETARKRFERVEIGTDLQSFTIPHRDAE